MIENEKKNLKYRSLTEKLELLKCCLTKLLSFLLDFIFVEVEILRPEDN